MFIPALSASRTAIPNSANASRAPLLWSQLEARCKPNERSEKLTELVLGDIEKGQSRQGRRVVREHVARYTLRPHTHAQFEPTCLVRWLEQVSTKNRARLATAANLK